MNDWHELLIELRTFTAELVRDARSGNASPRDIERRIAEREAIFERLNALEQPLPGTLEPLVHELVNLDQVLARWCQDTQQKIGAGLVKRRRTTSLYNDNPARIVIQSA